MSKATQYVARHPGSDGRIDYPQDEHAIWQELYARQEHNLPGRACDEYMQGLKALDLPKDRIPLAGRRQRCRAYLIRALL